MSKKAASSTYDGGKTKPAPGGGFPIEPVMVIHMTSAMMAFMSIPDLLLEKACRVNLAYGEEVCSALEAR